MFWFGVLLDFVKIMVMDMGKVLNILVMVVSLGSDFNGMVVKIVCDIIWDCMV